MESDINGSDYVPAPKPFSPFSSSSNNLKFLGTVAPIMSDLDVSWMIFAGIEVTKSIRGSADSDNCESSDGFYSTLE